MEGNGNIANILVRMLSGIKNRPMRKAATLLVLLAAVAVTWCYDAKTNRNAVRDAAGEAAQEAEPRPTDRPEGARQKDNGTGSEAVAKSGDVSKPAGGAVSEGVQSKSEAGRSRKGDATGEGQAKRVDFTKFRDGQWVSGVGTVTRVLEDDLVPPRHQRFILADEFGNTVLVAHNIDQAARVPGLAKGDEIAFRGEYRVNDRGGVIHWTHPDSSRRHPGGWLRKK